MYKSREQLRIRNASGLIRAVLRMTVLVSSLLPAAQAQTISGQISGTVTDAQGAVIVGAKVELTNDLSKQVREFLTDSKGSFLFPSILPGNYGIRVTQAGFKAYSEQSINVATQEHVDLHTITLELGDVSTSIEVTAAAAHVATDSSDRTITVNSQQIENTPSAGRSYMDTMRSLPGTAVVQSIAARGAQAGLPLINGGQSGQVLVTIDGVASQDSGTLTISGYLTPSVEAIGEVKVLVSNYTAEYGARAGGQVNFAIKNGTSQFHGSLYHYWRHETLAANEWFNNKNGLVKPRYRYQNPGGSIGGPLLIPGTRFNKNRQKLFFFFSYDKLLNKAVGATSSYNMPTALERSGDFSQTVTSTGTPITIKDPSTGLAFPGNMIPSSRFSPIGSAMLNIFPLPFTTDPSGQRQFNTQYQRIRDQPRLDKILRVDYTIGPKTTSYVRLIQDYQYTSGYGSILGPTGGNWGQFANTYALPAAGVVATVIHTFRPNLINELSLGVNKSHQIVTALDQAEYAKSQLPLKGTNGQPLALPNFFNANKYSLIPNINFGTTGAQSAGQSVTNAPPCCWDNRWPFEGTETMYNLSNNVTWVKEAHNIKAGLYLEFDARGTSNFSTSNSAGTYWFGSDTANPVDTGYPFSNLLLGSVQAYGEDNMKLINLARYHHIEWFAQDSWRVNRRLSLDLGMRFQIIQPFYSHGATLNVFSPSLYDVKKSGQLLFPAIVNGQRVALNPATNATYDYPRQTSFDPASYPASGTPYSGMKTFQERYFNTPPVLFGPRAGFAWDIFGKGKTAVRGGFGIFYGNAMAVDTIGSLMTTPPVFRSPVFYNTTFSSLLGTQGFYSPQDVNTGGQDYKNPTTYNWSFGIQQDLGSGIILDVAYVGNVAHHGMGINQNGPPTRDINAVAPLTTWTPAGGVNTKFKDPTNSTGGLYATNLIRALAGGYVGYGAIGSYESSGESYYDALQVQLNRRFGRRLQLSTNYTWSKTMTYSRQQWVDDSLTKNIAAGSRPHAFNVNFGYRFPEGSRLWKNRVSEQVLDGWNINGVGSIFFGTPMTIGCTAQSVPANLGNYWTGTPTGGLPFRCQMTGDLWLPSGATPSSVGSTADPHLWYPFARTSFILPSATSLGIGNTPPTLTYGPGFQNWDLSLYKEFRLGKEITRLLQLRIETFNTFNHFNPSNPNTSLTYNFVTGAQTNAGFGTITTAQNTSRKTALSLRFRF